MGSYSWNGGSGGWGTIANWTGGIPNSTTADATIAAAGTYTVTIETGKTYTVDSVTLGDGTAILDVLGTLDLGGTLGLMDISAGTLVLAGLVSGGTIDMNNQTLVAAGGTVSKTTSLVQGGSGYINLAGSTLTLAGTSTLQGYETGPGEMIISGVATFADDPYFEAGTTLDDTGTISLTSNMQWGSNADGSTAATVLTIAAGGVFDFTAENSGWGLNGTLNGTNAGLLESTSGGYYNVYFSNFINTGTISMTSGSDISLLGGNATLGGHITGAGDFYLGQGVTASLVSGLSDSAGAFTVSDGNTEVILEASQAIGGAFVEENGAYIDLNGDNLTLTGTGTLNAYIGGGGTVLIAGTLDSDFYLGSGSEELVTGTAIDASGNNRLDYDNGTAASILSIATTGTYDVTAVNSQIDYNGAIGTVINAGLFEVTEPGTTGSYFNLYEEFTQVSTGTIYLAADDDLSLTRGPDLLAGTIEGPGDIGVYQGSTVTLAAGLVMNAGNFTVSDGGSTVILESSRTIAGGFVGENSASVDLNGNNLTLSGSGALAAYFNGPGTLDVTGTFDNNGAYMGSGVTEIISGVEYQTSETRLDYDGGTAGAEISITSTGTYDIVSDTTIDDYSGYDNYGTIINSGLFEKTGNTSYTNVYSAFTNASTGTIFVETGLDLSFLNNQTNNISGLITGGGDIYFGGNGGPELIQAGATFGNLAQITVSDNNTQFILESSRTIAASTVFRDQNNGNVQLNGNTLTLGDGQFYNAYLQGSGELVITGDADFNGLNVIGTATILDKGTITQSGYNELGNSSSAVVTLSIASGAVYNIIDDTYINPQGTSAIVNAGLFEKTAGTGISDIYAPMLSTGTILAATGVIRLDNGGTLAGTLAGAGEIELNGGTFSLSPSAVVSVADFYVTGGADLLLENNVTFTGLFVLGYGGTINLGGYTLSLNNPGDVLGGNYIFGPGTVSESGRADINNFNLSGGAVLSDLGTITQDGGFYLGVSGTDTATLNIAAGAVYDILNDNNINTGGAAATINNAGLFEKTADNNGLNIYAAFNNAAGATLNVAYGYIQLNGGGALAGTITGAGTLYLNQYYTGQTYTLAAGAVVNVATFDLNGATLQLVSNFTLNDTFVEGGGDLNIAGYTLTMSGHDTLVNSYLTGAGTVNVTGTAELHNYNLTGNVTLLDSGTINADGVLYLGFNATDSGTLSIASGGVYDFINSSADVYLNTNGTVINAGLIEKTADNGQSQINAAINNTGTIDALRGTMDLSGGGTLGGTLEGGTIELGGGSFTLATAAVVSVATFDDYNATLDILNNRTFAGNFNQYYGGSTLALGGHAVTLAGIASLAGGAYAAQAGTLDVTGSADVNNYNLTGGAELLDAGTITMDGNLQIGENGTDTGVLSIASGAVFDILNDSYIYEDGTVAVQNAGLFEKTGSSTGRSYTQGAFTNTGTILLSSGILEEQSLVNSGTVTIKNAIDQTDTNVTAAAGKTGEFALTGGATLYEEGGIASSQSLVLSGTGNLIEISGGSTFAGTITGFTAGDTIDLLSTIVNGDAYANNVLTLKENGTVVTDITLTGIANIGSISLVQDGGSGTYIEFNNPGSITQPGGSVVADNWTVASGNFNTAADWSNGVPGTLSAASFAASLGTITVTDNTSNTIFSFNDQDSTATLTQSVGTLTVIDGGIWNGLVLQTGGEMLDESATLTLNSNATLAGTLAGAGDFYLGGNGNSVTLASTAVLNAATITEGNGANLAIESNLAYAGSFNSNNYGTLELDGFNLSLTGAANLTYGAHVAGPGTLTLKGPAELYNYEVQQGAQMVIAGAATQLSNLYIGNSGADTALVSISSTGTLNITADSNIYGNGTANLLDSGFLETTADYGTSNIQAVNLTETSAGIIDVTRGTLQLTSDNATLSGTLEGAGTLYFDSSNVTLAATAKLSVAALELYGSNVTLSANETYAGGFDLISGGGGTLELGAFTLDVTGTAALGGEYVGGTGTLEVTGPTEMQGMQLVNGAELLDKTTIYQDGGFALGYYATDNTSLVIASGAVYDIENNNNIGASGTATVINNGLFEKTAAFDNSYIAPLFDNGSTGTIDVAEGTLILQNGGTLGGTITGAGEFYIQNSGTFATIAGAVLTVATLAVNDQAVLGSNESYAGDFLLTNNIDLNGNNLTLTGIAALDSDVQGGGTIDVVSGDISGLYLYQGAVMNVTGTVTQDGGFSMSNTGTDSTMLNIGTTGVFDILTDNNINNNGTAVIDNAGLFEKTGDYGNSAIYAAFTNASTGTIDVQRGFLYFDDGGSFAGTLTGAVDGNVPQGAIIVNGGVFSLASTAVVSVAELELDNGTLALGGNFNYAGSFSGTGGALDLDGHNITLASPNLGGFILTGPGTMDVTGSGAIGMDITGGAVLVDQGTLLYQGLQLGFNGSDSAEVSIAAGGVFDIIDNNYIGAQGASSIVNAGLFEKTADYGYMQVDAAFTNQSAGTIDVVLGTIGFDGGGVLGGTLEGAGEIDLNGNNTLTSTVVTVGTLNIESATTLAASLTYGGDFIIGYSQNMAIGGEHLDLTGNADLIGGFSGAGTVTVAGFATVQTADLYGGATLLDTGTIIQIDELRFSLNDESSDTLSIAKTGVYDIQDDTNFHNYNNGSNAEIVTNAGLLEKTGNNGLSDLQVTLTNTGTVLVDSGTLQVDAVSNLASGTLSGGTWAAIAGLLGPTLALEGGTIAVDAAAITLAGAGSALYAGGVALEASLTSITSAGILDLAGGRGFAATNAIADAGKIFLTGGTLAAPSLTIASGGTLSGAGTAAGPVTNNGVIDILGGTLDLTSSLSGTGSLLIGAGDDLILGAGVAAGEKITFGGSLDVLALGAPGTMLGTLVSLAPSDTIDLEGTSLKSATISGTHLIVSLTAGGTISYALASANAHDRAVISSDGHGGTDVTIFGAAAASAVTPTPVNFGEAHAGAVLTQTYTVSNTSSFGAYTENLDAIMGTHSTGVTDSGSFSGLGSGQTNSSALKATLVTSTGGLISGTATVNLYTDGKTVPGDGAGTLAIGTESVALTGTIFNYATASTGTASLGEAHAGGTVAGFITISNAAVAGAYSENLDAGFSGTSAGLTGSGSISELAAGSTNSSALALSLASASGGVVTGKATLGVISDGSTIDTLGTTTLANDTVTAAGTFFNYATATIAATVKLGEGHVGGTLTHFITLSNSAVANGYSENLDASFSGTSADLSGSNGGVSELAAGSTSANGLDLVLSASTAGTQSGTAVIGLISDGSTIDTLGTTVLASQTVAASGTLFNYATASTVAPVNFGIVHVGQSISQTITLSNTAAAGKYSENLDSSFSGTTGSFSTSGTVSELKAGAKSTSLAVTLQTGAAGTLTGATTLGVISDGSTIDTLGTTTLAGETVTLTGTVNNYATATVEAISGVGTLSTSGTTIDLNFGTVTKGATGVKENIGILNSAVGPADVLSGSFVTSGTTGFTNAGLATFSSEAAGSADTKPVIQLNTGTLGTFTETIVIDTTGSNASGYKGALAPETLVVTGTVAAAGAVVTVPAADTASVPASPAAMSFIAPASIPASPPAAAPLTGSAASPAITPLHKAGMFGGTHTGFWQNKVAPPAPEKNLLHGMTIQTTAGIISAVLPRPEHGLFFRE